LENWFLHVGLSLIRKVVHSVVNDNLQVLCLKRNSMTHGVGYTKPTRNNHEKFENLYWPLKS